MTDLNYFQGKILAENFPFPLDRAAVESRLTTVAAEIAAATGISYTLHQLAEGFLRVVNTNMVQAIRSISIAKGCDPRLCAGGFRGCGRTTCLRSRKRVRHCPDLVASGCGRTRAPMALVWPT